MRKHLFKPLLALALVLVCGNVWGETYTLTPNNVSTGNNASAYVTSAYSFTFNGISWNFNHWNPKTLQVKTNQSSAASEFNFKNTSAFPGKITSVVINFSTITVSNEKGFCFVGGSSAISNLSEGTSGTWDSTKQTLTWTPAPTDNFTYFAFYQNGKVASGSNFLVDANAIVVTYEASVGPVDPTITTTNMSCGVSESFDVSQMFSSNSDGAITYSVEGANADDYELDGSDFLSEVAGNYTIKASQAAVDGKYNAGEATAILTVIGMYTLHIIQPELGGTLTVKDGETPLTDGCKVTVGTKLTCEVTDIPEGKRFSRFYVNYDNDGEKYKQTNPATFDNLPNEGITEATVTVRYQDLAKYTATFVSNNEVWNKADLWENEGLVFPDDPEIEGYAFMGWTTSSTVNVDGSGIAYAKEGDNINDNTTFYAVFAVQEGSGEGCSQTLTIKSSYKEGRTSYGSYDIDGWTGRFIISNSGDNYFLQLGHNATQTSSAYNSHLATPSSDSAIESITIQTNNGTASSRAFFLCGRNDIGFATIENATYGSGSIKEKEGSVTINVTGAPKQVYIYSNGTAYIASITVKYVGAIYSNFTTTPSAADLYSVTITSSGYSTLYLDYAAEVPEGVTAFYATEYDAVNDQVVLTEVSDNVIAANQGVILKGTTGTEYSFVETASATAPTANLLRGTVASEGISGLSGENGDYILKSGAFAPISGGTLAAHKAYLHVEGRKTHDESNSIGIRLDGATMIENMTVVEDNIYFDLQGRKVENPINGLYIVNGKKVMVK